MAIVPDELHQLAELELEALGTVEAQPCLVTSLAETTNPPETHTPAQHQENP